MKKSILLVLGISGMASVIILAVANSKRHLAMIGSAALLIATNAQAQTLINGAGSTFDYPAITKWREAYQAAHPDVNINYASIGSGGGQKQLLNQTVDFGASDAPMKDEQLAQAPGKIIQLPIVAGGVAIMYNLPGSPKLKLDGDTLANIYLGNITAWNDPKIAVLNPGVSLPSLPIVPVHRTESSGTTFIFSDYLSSISPVWADTVGKGTAIKWPAGIGLGGKGSEGVAGQVKQTSGSIGYGELAYADESKIPYADMKNSVGNFVSPASSSVSAALATAKIPDDFRFSMVNSPGADSYPIAGASWVLIYQTQKNSDHGHKLVDFLKWAITDGQKISSTLDYAPLPDSIQQRELALLGTVKY